MTGGLVTFRGTNSPGFRKLGLKSKPCTNPKLQNRGLLEELGAGTMIFMVLLDVNVCLFSSRILQIPPILIFNMSFLHPGTMDQLLMRRFSWHFIMGLQCAQNSNLLVALAARLGCLRPVPLARSHRAAFYGPVALRNSSPARQVSDCPYMLSGCFTIKFDLAAHGKMGFVTPSWVDDKDWYRATGPTVSG